MFRGVRGPLPGGTPFAPKPASAALAGLAGAQTFQSGETRRGPGAGCSGRGKGSPGHGSRRNSFSPVVANEVIEINGICNYCTGTRLVELVIDGKEALTAGDPRSGLSTPGYQHL